MSSSRLDNWQHAENIERNIKLAEEVTTPEKFYLWLLLTLAFLIEYVKAFPEICCELWKLIQRPERKSIIGKTTLVTGAGNGLGRMLSLYLAREGAKVICVDIDLKSAEQTAEEINTEYGECRAKAYKTDVSSVEEVKNLKNDVMKDFGVIDILVNNAGVIPFIGIFEGSEMDIKKTIDVNLLSHFWMVRAFVPDMQARGEGHVVAISSISSIYHGCYPNATVYATSKCGINALTSGITTEAPNVKTTTVMPITIATRRSVVDHVHGLMPHLTPEAAAETIIDAVLKEHKVITVPGELYPLLSFLGIFPSFLRKPIENVVSPEIR